MKEVSGAGASGLHSLELPCDRAEGGRAPDKTAGALAPAIAPSGLEPNATVWGEPGLSDPEGP